MPNSSSSPEASAVDEAYAEQIRGLFKVLSTNLIDAPGSDRQSPAKFSTGLIWQNARGIWRLGR